MAERLISVLSDAGALAGAAADRIAQLARNAIDAQNSFSIALSGGSTPKALYELLASDRYASQIQWDRWEIYFSDERCVGPEDDQSNYHMAKLALLDRVPIPPANVHRMKGELDPQQAAIEYGQLLKEKFGEGGLDVILLGMGDDGHTASLFPGTAALGETHHRCVANYVEKLKVWRLTMSAPFINRARHAIVLISGAAKASRLSEVLEGPQDAHRLPIQLIDPAQGEMLWLIDAEAAGMSDVD